MFSMLEWYTIIVYFVNEFVKYMSLNRYTHIMYRWSFNLCYIFRLYELLICIQNSDNQKT